MKKYTLLVDGNFFMFSRLFFFKKKGPESLGTKEELTQYAKKLAMDFAHEMRMFRPITERVVFMVDSNSWRKGLFDTITIL